MDRDHDPIPVPEEVHLDLNLPFDTAYQITKVLMSEVGEERRTMRLSPQRVTQEERARHLLHVELRKRFIEQVQLNHDVDSIPLRLLQKREPIQISLNAKEVDLLNKDLLSILRTHQNFNSNIDEIVRDSDEYNPFKFQILGREMREFAKEAFQEIRKESDPEYIRTIVQLNQAYQEAGGTPRPNYIQFREGIEE